MSGSLTFDQVQVGEERLDAESFLALPFFERVEHILSGSLDFYLDGQPVDRRAALDSLRTHSAQAA